ncbi:hypothetical protein [Pseudomonas sp. TH21]|jgi:hypothetical protein|uniref:hypothetical protein n=1 Tax=Pseudomonas sp. TH21 TaxID=2796387 RepID=UPI001F5BCD3A|nr:hypothetical protein [Pseudomonas sp. TH21]
MKPTLQKLLLYRSVNTRTHGVRHGSCRAYRYERHTKSEKDKRSNRGSMHSHQRHGFDYTPLFRFLLSKVGHPWDEVFSEAKARLDRPEPIFWMVAMHESDKEESVRTDENSYYSGLWVDEAGLLQKVNPMLTPEQMGPFSDYDTHTFNGVVFAQSSARKRWAKPTV